MIPRSDRVLVRTPVNTTPNIAGMVFGSGSVWQISALPSRARSESSSGVSGRGWTACPNRLLRSKTRCTCAAPTGKLTHYLVFRHARRAVNGNDAAAPPCAEQYNRPPSIGTRARFYQPPAFSKGVIDRLSNVLVWMIVHFCSASATIRPCILLSHCKERQIDEDVEFMIWSAKPPPLYSVAIAVNIRSPAPACFPQPLRR